MIGLGIYLFYLFFYIQMDPEN